MNLRLSGAWLTVNRACNFRCKWCYALGTEYQQSDDMTQATAEELLRLAAGLGITHILFIGGEPTLWPHLCKTIRSATELGLRTVLITNGFRLADKRFVEELQFAGLNGVNLSMKAGDHLLHEELTRTKFSTFDTVLNGIRNLADSIIQFEVTTIASTCVLHQMDKICQIAVDNGAKKFSIDFCSVTFEEGKPSSAYMPDPDKVVNAIISQYPAMDKATGGGFHLAQSLPTCLWPAEFLAQLEAKNQIGYGCHVMTREGLVFDRTGQLLICNHLHDFPLGQIGVDFTDPASFAQFWKSSGISGHYNQINTYPAQRCINCQTYEKCGGGCPLLWFVYNPENVTREEESDEGSYRYAPIDRRSTHEKARFHQQRPYRRL